MMLRTPLAVRLLILGRSEEIAVEILMQLQQHGYLTVCERTTDLQGFTSALTTGKWTVAVCVLPSPDEHRAAVLLCNERRPAVPCFVVGAQESLHQDSARPHPRAWLPIADIERLGELLNQEPD
jgi:hypothetical protein